MVEVGYSPTELLAVAGRIVAAVLLFAVVAVVAE